MQKHVEDVWTLVSSLMKNVMLPRVSLKNGKRSKKQFFLSQTVRRDTRQVENYDAGDNVRDVANRDGMNSGEVVTFAIVRNADDAGDTAVNVMLGDG